MLFYGTKYTIKKKLTHLFSRSIENHLECLFFSNNGFLCLFINCLVFSKTLDASLFDYFQMEP